MRWTKYSAYIGFVAGLIAVGIPYSLIPYSKLNLPNALLGPQLIVVVAAAAVLCATRGASFRDSVAIAGASIPAVVVMRLIVDVALDHTTHNMWPFELVIAVLLGGACSAAGAAIGWLTAKFFRSATQGT
jgi:hypothetical protein